MTARFTSILFAVLLAAGAALGAFFQGMMLARLPQLPSTSTRALITEAPI